MSEEEKNTVDTKRKKFIRIAALVGVILLVGMYAVSIIAALSKSENAKALFAISMYCTFVVPVIIYVLQLVYKLATGNKD